MFSAASMLHHVLSTFTDCKALVTNTASFQVRVRQGEVGRWWSDAVRYCWRWPGGFWRRINFAQQLRVVCERKRTFIKKKKRCNKQRTIYLKKAKRISQTQSDSDQSQLHVSYTSSPLSTAWATEAEIPSNPYQEYQDVKGSDCSRGGCCSLRGC